MRENEYQQGLKKRIREAIPGCTILKNDPNDIQGFPDLTILYKGRFAILEVKRSENEPHQPNQDYYVEHFANDTCSAFIFPENEKEVLGELQRALGVTG